MERFITVTVGLGILFLMSVTHCQGLYTTGDEAGLSGGEMGTSGGETGPSGGEAGTSGGETGTSGSETGNGIESSVETYRDRLNTADSSPQNNKGLEYENSSEDDCCINLNATWLFRQMATLDEKYANALNDFQHAAEENFFDKRLLDEMLKTQGESQRNIHSAKLKNASIPHGFDLGGRCMIQMNDSILFFHHLKLRDSTLFRIDSLHSDLVNMTLTAHLSLHDLLLGGAYERALIEPGAPSTLFYKPTYEEVDILLEDVRYNMEGRYRLLNDELVIEFIVSSIEASQVLLMYKPNANATRDCDNTVVRLAMGQVDQLLLGIKTNLEIWLRGYFNDYLRYFGPASVATSKECQNYYKLRASTLNRFADQAIETLTQKMRKIKATCLLVPGYSIYTINQMSIELKNGKLRGLETMHRRSMATGSIKNNVREVNTIIGFGELRLVYEYEGIITPYSPAIKGLIVLSCDQLTAKMALGLVQDQEASNLTFTSYQQLGKERLTVQGPLIRMVANFKSVLELHITSLMYNTLIQHVSLLGQLNKCDAKLPGPCEDGDISIEEINRLAMEENPTTCKCPPA